MPLIHYLQLALTDAVGPITLKRMIEALGPADSVCRASIAQLRSVEGIGTAKAEKIHASLGKARGEAATELAKAQQLGLQIICPEDEVYPLLLKTIPDPPAVLYVKGTLEPRDLNAFALVGSQSTLVQASDNGVKALQADALAESGLQLATYYLKNPSAAPLLSGAGYYPGTGLGKAAVFGRIAGTKVGRE